MLRRWGTKAWWKHISPNPWENPGKNEEKKNPSSQAPKQACRKGDDVLGEDALGAPAPFPPGDLLPRRTDKHTQETLQRCSLWSRGLHLASGGFC